MVWFLGCEVSERKVAGSGVQSLRVYGSQALGLDFLVDL